MKKRFAKYRYQIIYTLVIIIIPLFIFAFSRWNYTINIAQNKEKDPSSEAKVAADKKTDRGTKLAIVSGTVSRIDPESKSITIKETTSIDGNNRIYKVFVTNKTSISGISLQQNSNLNFNSIKTIDFLRVTTVENIGDKREFEASSIQIMPVPVGEVLKQ